MGIERREFCKRAAAGAAALGLAAARAAETPFRLRYILASSLYGRLRLEEILPEVRKAGAEHVDIWPERHANQREQIEAMGHEKFAALLQQHGAKLGILTRYDLSPFGLQPEMAVAKKLGASMLICGSGGPKGLQGDALKAAAAKFIEQMKPHVAAAEDAGLVLGIENHGNTLLDSPDAVRRFAEAVQSKHLGVALAPYHLPQDAALLAKLIEDIGERLVHFYAWQHGKGCMTKLPKEEELLQMPGRGPLDFAPLLAALRKIGYKGWTEVFMHPVPRGIPILPTAAEVTAEVVKAQRYLEGRLE